MVVEREIQFGKSALHYTKGRKGYPEEFFAFFQSIFPLSTSILDLGCGTAIGTKQLFDHGYKLIKGVDIDEKMLEEARALLPQVPFFQKDAANLPFTPSSFDCITAFGSFHWFCNFASIEEIKRVLKEKGVFCIVHKDDVSDFHKEFSHWLQDLSGLTFAGGKNDYHPIEKLQESYLKMINKEQWNCTEIYSEEEAISFCQSLSIWNCLTKDLQHSILPKIKEFLTPWMSNRTFIRPVLVKCILVKK